MNHCLHPHRPSWHLQQAEKRLRLPACSMLQLSQAVLRHAARQCSYMQWHDQSMQPASLPLAAALHAGAGCQKSAPGCSQHHKHLIVKEMRGLVLSGEWRLSCKRRRGSRTSTCFSQLWQPGGRLAGPCEPRLGLDAHLDRPVSGHVLALANRARPVDVRACHVLQQSALLVRAELQEQQPCGVRKGLQYTQLGRKCCLPLVYSWQAAPETACTSTAESLPAVRQVICSSSKQPRMMRIMLRFLACSQQAGRQANLLSQ